MVFIKRCPGRRVKILLVESTISPCKGDVVDYCFIFYACQIIYSAVGVVSNDFFLSHNSFAYSKRCIVKGIFIFQLFCVMIFRNVF
jgi:hypothetical protein